MLGLLSGVGENGHAVSGGFPDSFQCEARILGLKTFEMSCGGWSWDEPLIITGVPPFRASFPEVQDGFCVYIHGLAKVQVGLERCR